MTDLLMIPSIPGRSRPICINQADTWLMDTNGQWTLQTLPVSCRNVTAPAAPRSHINRKQHAEIPSHEGYSTLAELRNICMHNCRAN